MKVKTVELQEMVARAVKGASQNKLIPLTSLMKVECYNGILTLETTNMSDSLYIKKEIDEDNDFYVVVQVEQFSKLVSKMTSENITLELDNNILIVKGNGTYKIELPLDESGEMIKYPDPVSKLKFEGEASSTIKLDTIKTILTANKVALATTLEVPVYTGYYAGDKVISTDTFKICGLNAKLFDEPVMISPETMNLLDVMTEETINVDKADGILLFSTKDCVLYSHIMEGIDEFAIEPISALLEEQFKSSCKVNKNTLLALLDRISLFVGPYDNKAVTLTFTENGIDVSSKKSNGIETIPYLENKDFAPYTCVLDITMLSQQVKANAAESIEIQYGNESSIKIVDGDVTQIVALLE